MKPLKRIVKRAPLPTPTVGTIMVDELPQCQAAVAPPGHDLQWRKTHYPDRDHTLCARNATIELNGKVYYRPHAGVVLLRMLERGELS